MVEEMQDELHDTTPYGAVKTLHDALCAEDVERTVPSLGEPFITAYLLEKNGVIASDGDVTEYRSFVERRPSSGRLREMFWEQYRTLWWIGILAGVHPSLVTYWFYEDNIPLMERNYTDASMEQIRAYRDSEDT